MADIVVKNGYNGFSNSKKNRDNYKRRQNSFKLPPLEAHKDDLIYREDKAHSPVLQPSLSVNTTASTEFVILLDDEIRRIHQLSVNLGITHHYEVAEYHNRFHCRRLGRLPKLEESKYWRQSHNWKKRTETGGINELDLRRNFVTSGKHFDTSSVHWNNLPRGRKKLLEPVNIPALGCSYRLPILEKQKHKTG